PRREGASGYRVTTEDRIGHENATNEKGPRFGRPQADFARVPRKSHWSDLNRRPLDYESRALPLSYSGGYGSSSLNTRGYRMPWRGFEPRRLSALPPQDSVSTSFTTRASRRR